jgi:hypothetical protein
VPGHKTKLFVFPGSGVHGFGIEKGPAENAWRAAAAKYYAAARGGGAQAINEANMTDYLMIHATTGVKSILDATDPKLAQYNLNNLFDGGSSR